MDANVTPENPEAAIGEQPHAVEISLNAMGKGSVVVGGQDLSSQVYGVEVRAVHGEPTQVALHAGTKGVEFDGPALVTVVKHDDEAASPAAVAAWISRVDPATLEQAVLHRFDLDASKPHGLVEAMLRQMVEWAEGK